MKYKVGDRVIIRDDLSRHHGSYYMSDDLNIHDSVIAEMEKFRGQIATITKISLGKYRIDLDNNTWNWVDEMFAGNTDDEIEIDHDALTNLL